MLAVTFMICVAMATGGCSHRESQRLPDSAFQVNFETPNIPTEMIAGTQVIVDVSLRNTSTSTWPSKPDSSNRNAVHLSYHWATEKGDRVIYDGVRTALPQDVKSGDSVALKTTVRAPERLGRYILEMTLVQEGVAWFPDKGGEKISVPVSVVQVMTENRVDNPPDDRDETPRVGKTTSVSGDEAKRLAAIKSEARLPAENSSSERLAAPTGNFQEESDKRRELWSVQVVSLSHRTEAESLARKLKSKGYDAYVATAKIKSKDWYQVHVGRLATRREAETLRETLRAAEKLDRTFIAHKG
ncbi:MAG: SPOR domain-containing protein [Candidatus Binatia bacterium]